MENQLRITHFRGQLHAPLADNCWFLSGPTAAGKTDVGLELARKLNAEILSLDSMAVYRGMDIGTAKPSLAQQSEVPHHLLDLVEPQQDFSLARYLDLAEQTVDDIKSRGKTPLFVGGTPLYLKARLRGVFQGPAADWNLRHELEREAAADPTLLHARLSEVDAVSAARLHANDTRRLIRALEVFLKTGQPISALQEQFEIGADPQTCRVFVLQWPRQKLQQRIDERVTAMFRAGFVDEVRRLAANGPLGRTASQAVGYREVLSHLAGEMDQPATVALVQQRTRQFAKRQLTWFRSLSECRTIEVDESLNPAAVAAQIAEAGENVTR